MAGTVKVWWHDGAKRDVRYHDLPVVNEPELDYETVSVSSTPASTGPAPKNSSVAIVESDVNVRYLVRPPGDISDADAVSSKPVAATGFGVNSIAVDQDDTISFVEG